MTIAELMKEKREQKKMTLADVARNVGVDRATVQRWEKGIINIDRKHISAICRTLSIDPTIFCHPNEVVFPEERQLIAAWRVADEISREMVRRALHMDEKNNPSESETFII